MKNVVTSLAIAFLFIATGCENDLAKVDAISAKIAETPVETSKEVEMIYSDSAKVKARMITPVFLQYKTEQPYDEMPKGLKIDFFNPGATKVESTLTANYGIRKPSERKIEVRNNVVVINQKGEKLNTERLVWDEASRKIFSDKFVKITTTDKIIQGYGLEANEDLSNYKIKQMSGIVYLDQTDSLP
ncbi:LPS export ABC transporter periplasmic protein LptC [Solitalea longa]|uniref:LPS export ABC transporter periplasmic protein LptC n=1 Tax=Solitalea longa TaxID=2079460 RepID=UPI0013FE3411|nr:LPS export ABC transporter periplasmic protein LptC [Solitalea longa]